MSNRINSHKDLIGARSEAVSYQQLLDLEVNPVPAALRENTNTFLGSDALSTDRYLSRDFYEQEKHKLWPRVWQAVCRETEVENSGDFFTHQIADNNILVLRTESGEIKGYRNACLHRGRQLKSGAGNSRELKCPFHGFTWSLEGQFKGAPCQWDFPHVDSEDFSLPQVTVDTWGGWVFVNIDGKAAPLTEYLGVMDAHFSRWTPEKTYKAMHLKKVLRCNWKLAHEAFIESYHTVSTHPQLLLYTADANSQYDCFNDHVSRTITPMGVASPHLPNASEQQSADQWLRIYDDVSDQDLPKIPKGQTAREYLGRMNIERFSEMYQQDLSGIATNSEVLDAILYSIFPNFAPWAGYRPNVTYRFLPYKDDHEMCTMEIFLMMRYPEDEPRPRDCAMIFVDADQRFADTEGISAGLATVFDQDFSNLPQVHKGLKNLVSGQVELGNYQEVRIRHFHQTLDKYMADELP
jgi:phenylpropionate dioxygenase-like ring-hydroxylating dioxygenase large terminal subunit